MRERELSERELGKLIGGLEWLDKRMEAFDKKQDIGLTTLGVHDAALREIVPAVKEMVPIVKDIAPAVKIISTFSPLLKRGVRQATALVAAGITAVAIQLQSCHLLQNIGSNVEVAVDNTQTYDETTGEVVTAVGASKTASDTAKQTEAKVDGAKAQLDKIEEKIPEKSKPVHPTRPSKRPIRRPPPPPEKKYLGDYIRGWFQ